MSPVLSPEELKNRKKKQVCLVRFVATITSVALANNLAFDADA